MKAFVTGGTGFIGERVVQQLTEQGYDVTCLTRNPEKATRLRQWGAFIIQGDITDRESMRKGMSGADVVFHIAAWYEVGLPPGASQHAEQINVAGTENVLGLAVELGIPKIVYTSTVFVLGDTYGAVVDETHQRNSPFQSHYDRTKYQAHQIAQRYIKAGAPIVIVMPGAVYGPGDHSLLGMAARLVLYRMLPILPGANMGLSLVHVDDVAQGHVLAAEKGQIGESYLLGGEVMTLGDAVQVIARLSGMPAPLLLLDDKLPHALESVSSWLEKFVPLPQLLSAEMMRMLGCTWMVTSAKAKRELGYTYRPFEEGIAETIQWELLQRRAHPARWAAPLALVGATAALILWLWQRRRHTSLKSC